MARALVLVFSLAAVVALMLTAMPIALADPGTSVSIEDALVVAVGGNADVQLRINTDEANGIGSATITLTVDTSVVEVVEVAGGDLGTVYWNTVGSTTTMSAATGSSPGPGWDGSTVTFATVTLNAEGTGGECSDLHVEVASMYDATAGNPQKIIPDPVTDCEFCIVIGTPRLEGDVYPLGSGDGVINSADFQLVAQHIVHTTTLTGDDFLAADVNDSGTVDAVDLQLVAQYLVGTIPSFPGGIIIP